MKFTIIFDQLIIHELSPFESKEDREAYIKNLPNAKKRTGWSEKETAMFDCSDTFEANSIKEAKHTVKTKYVAQYDGAEYFDCKDEKGNTVFTEEDL